MVAKVALDNAANIRVMEKLKAIKVGEEKSAYNYLMRLVGDRKKEKLLKILKEKLMD